MNNNSDRASLLNKVLGRVQNGTQLLYRYIDLSRRTGRTTQLFELVDKDSIIIVNTFQTVALYKEYLLRNKGITPRIIVVNVGDRTNLVDVMIANQSSLVGLDYDKIVIDNAILDTILQNQIKEYDLFSYGRKEIAGKE